MKVFIIGTGVDGRSTLTKEAENALLEAEVLIGAERVLSPFTELGKETFVSYDPREIAGKVNSCGYERAAVLMSGDCGFFSGAKKLLPLLQGCDMEVVPGISSAAYFCSRLGLSYEKMKFVTLHGRTSNIAVNVKMNEYCFFLLGGEMTAADVCRRLCGFGLADVRVHIGADLGYDSERIVTGKASKFTEAQVGRLAVLITENSSFLRGLPSAIDDEKFTRGDIPMTKSEVRCIVVSKLNIAANSIVWDIGCGTGSVSVEAAFRCPDGRVFAFDKKHEAAELTAENASAFGCDNIFVSEGNCPDNLTDVPAPDKVFIGGSSGELKGIFESIHSKNPNADIAVTAVSLETLHEAADCFKKYGKIPEIVQIAAARTKRIGSHTMLQAQNPVFIISGRSI